MAEAMMPSGKNSRNGSAATRSSFDGSPMVGSKELPNFLDMGHFRADFLIAEVTAGIASPEIAIGEGGAGTEAAAAGAEPFTAGAAAIHKGLALPVGEIADGADLLKNRCRERIAAFPDGGEWGLLDVAKLDVLQN